MPGLDLPPTFVNNVSLAVSAGALDELIVAAQTLDGWSYRMLPATPASASKDNHADHHRLRRELDGRLDHQGLSERIGHRRGDHHAVRVLDGHDRHQQRLRRRRHHRDRRAK
jgi:hypothetical protein